MIRRKRRPPPKRKAFDIVPASAYRTLVPEHELQVSIIDTLNLQGRRDNAFWFSIPNAGKRSPVVRRRMLAEGLRAGVADIGIMLCCGRMIWIECKRPHTGKASPAQIVFENFCIHLDHPYYTVRTLAEAIAVLRKHGVIR